MSEPQKIKCLWFTFAPFLMPVLTGAFGLSRFTDYGFNNISSAQWLHHKKIYYWGDIDTHGFAILNQLRGILQDVKSFLMDIQTLLSHRELWGFESNPEKANLERLTPDETKPYDQLRNNHWGENIRLEQERVGFKFLTDVLQEL